MLLSVCVVSFNHAPFIAQAVRSIAEQKTNFAFEIVIGDDASTDNTREVLREVADTLPVKLRVVAQTTRRGVRENFLAALAECRSEFVAFLDGDDFWTDASKLARQVALLREHSDMSFCFHRVRDLRSAGGEDDTPRIDPGPIVDLFYLLQTTNPVAFGSVVARRDALSDVAEWWAPGLILGDWPVCILLGSRGRVGYLPREMARYRIHGSGAWSTLLPHARVTYVLHMLLHIASRVQADAASLIRDRIDELARWWASDAPLLAEGDFEEALRTVKATGNIDLVHLLLVEQMQVARRLEEGRAWLEQHAKSWETLAEEHAEALRRKIAGGDDQTTVVGEAAG